MISFKTASHMKIIENEIFFKKCIKIELISLF